MRISRRKNTITGTSFGVIQKVLALVFPFAIRTIFIRTIGAEYLGLNSLFTSILQILNLAELGVGSALVFSMYKPIAEDDKEKICALMNLYKKYYRIIGLIVLSLGLAILPFLRFFIKGDVPTNINIYIIYIMSLSSNVLTYWLFAYRNSLFQAHQRLDIIYIITIIINILQYSIQIVLLLVLKNYYMYLAVTIIAQILLNLITAFFSKKIYPDYYPDGELKKDEVKTINKKIGALMTAKVGGVISNSFDTVVVSAFLGLEVLAIYQNYFYIVTAISGIIMIFFSAIQAGIGNYLLSSEKKDSYNLFNNINFIVFFVVNISCCCLITMYQPFMIIWVGDEYLLANNLVFMFAGYLLSYIIIRPAIVFKDAAGIWSEDKYRPLVTSLTNLSLNLATISFLGLYGVLGSTIVSYLFVGFPWVLYNINKYMFKIDFKRFIIREFLYLFVIVLSCFASYMLCFYIKIDNIYLNLLKNMILSVFVSMIIFIIFFAFTKENKYFMNYLKQILKKIKR